MFFLLPCTRHIGRVAAGDNLLCCSKIQSPFTDLLPMTVYRRLLTTLRVLVSIAGLQFAPIKNPIRSEKKRYTDNFPDGLGDDLIVEVLDSKGKHYGRVVAQVVTIAEDPVSILILISFDKKLALVLVWWMTNT